MEDKLDKFNNEVALKYSLYNSLFLTLPFQKMEEVGTLLTLFSKYCAEQIQKGRHPQQMVQHFLKKHLAHIHGIDPINILFTMLQFVERQIVLFDALEDAAYAKTHDLKGPGSLSNLLHKILRPETQQRFIEQIHQYQIKIVLTAHPTQFYPYPVLAIITQLTTAIKENDLKKISDLLWQMGKTSFKHQQKPTPYQEALSIIWYLEHIFYKVIPKIQFKITSAIKQFGSTSDFTAPNIELGFWPGSDRDGNPNVNAETTKAVAGLLKNKVIRMYIADLHQLTKKFTFKGVLENLYQIQETLEYTLKIHELSIKNKPGVYYKKSEDLLNDLYKIKDILIREHNSLFLDTFEEFMIKVKCFGFHFASMDMRENSPMHRQAFQNLLQLLANQNIAISESELKKYNELNFIEKLQIIEKIIKKPITLNISDDAVTNSNIQRTFQAIKIIKLVQESNGETGLCRYIISNTQSSLDILELYTMLHVLGNFKKTINVDIIPLFESINDLQNAEKIMQELYDCPFYQAHLKHRKNIQTIMLGFSDGTKDGGYVAANWSIYKAKVNLTQLSEKYNIKVIFFDGRGGPPARGGGNMHNFYRSLGSKISHQNLQLTIQGQTISSNFGTKNSARYNIEQLFTAGLEDLLFPSHVNDLNEAESKLLAELSIESQKAYYALKEDELFISYLEEMTPLKYFGELNIGSRPTSRHKSSRLEFSDLRAIPFVGSWSQLKQNIPGYYGFGTALKHLIEANKKNELISLYKNSLFFRSLVENTMMSLCKTFFPLTTYMKDDPKFGLFWKKLCKEAELTTQLLLEISHQHQLLEKDPLNQASIQLREQIVLPLLVIQQFALTELKEMPTHETKLMNTYKEIILKALAANTNASRNSA